MKTFDDGTLTKLEIFEKYFEAWLPTFVMSNFTKPIQVFDLFAGSGYDELRNKGSPIRILEMINKFRDKLKNKSKKVHIFFNDNNRKKVEILKNNVTNKIKELSLESFIVIDYSNTKFKECLKRYDNELKNGCNLLFIDQYGFKEVDESTFQYLIRLDTTEFIFFISSSYIHRFGALPDVQKLHPKFDFNEIINTSRKKIHNIICEEYRKYVPDDISDYGLIPFSIMKSDKNNVYGLIFVSKHIRGADKFLNVVWRKNKINGNANFDIDDEVSKLQLSLFEGKKLTKIAAFQQSLKEKILNKEICNNLDVYLYTLNSGHIPQHAVEIIIDMKRNNLINYDGKSPLVNYKQAIRNRKIVNFRVTNENH